MLCVKILHRIFESEKIASGFPVLVCRSGHCYMSLQFYFCARTGMPTGTHLHTHLLTYTHGRLMSTYIVYTDTILQIQVISFKRISLLPDIISHQIILCTYILTSFAKRKWKLQGRSIYTFIFFSVALFFTLSAFTACFAICGVGK